MLITFIINIYYNINRLFNWTAPNMCAYRAHNIHCTWILQLNFGYTCNSWVIGTYSWMNIILEHSHWRMKKIVVANEIVTYPHFFFSEWTYHHWPQLCHLWGLILKHQGYISTLLLSNHPTWRGSIMQCILFSPYLILNIAQTLVSIFHILLIFVQI